jgi:pyridoxal biosynthesis lyase PdxS
MIKEIMAAVTIPVMAKARIGHFVECQVRISLPRHTIMPNLIVLNRSSKASE